MLLMNDRPIGVIDSGVGGLTVAYEIMRQLPKENILYLGDIKRCPYGSRTKEEIIKYTLEMVRYLLGKNIKMLVIACNTATAYTLDLLKAKLDIPVIGVIKPGARAAIKTTKNKKIAVLGTEATIKSKSYNRALERVLPDVNVIGQACPMFVPMIEKGIINRNNISESINPIKNKGIDTIILGCTHYPLIKDEIQREVGKGISIISSGEETAREINALLEIHHLHNSGINEPYYQFYTTGDSEMFKKQTRNLFQNSPNTVKSIVIELVEI